DRRLAHTRPLAAPSAHDEAAEEGAAEKWDERDPEDDEPQLEPLRIFERLNGRGDRAHVVRVDAEATGDDPIHDALREIDERHPAREGRHRAESDPVPRRARLFSLLLFGALLEDGEALLGLGHE